MVHEMFLTMLNVLYFYIIIIIIIIIIDYSQFTHLTFALVVRINYLYN